MAILLIVRSPAPPWIVKEEILISEISTQTTEKWSSTHHSSGLESLLNEETNNEKSKMRKLILRKLILGKST